ncbi:MAG: DUF2007 domain-containing protein [Actinomycetota bacterium]
MQEDFVRVYSAGSVPEGYLAKGLLEAEGIPVLVKGEAESPYPVGSMDLWVPRSLEIQARLILEEYVGDDEP